MISQNFFDDIIHISANLFFEKLKTSLQNQKNMIQYKNRIP